ncbi:hypothetical protein B566_EDAN012647 [Ephemera danica]|nr:hypothetical protein B566_EDAN012647 [Ephemera danica]
MKEEPSAAIIEGKILCPRPRNLPPVNRSIPDTLIYCLDGNATFSAGPQLIVITKQANEEGIEKLSWTKFHDMFKEKNLGIHKLKKDLCEFCCKYELLVKAGTVSEDDKKRYEEHRADVISMRDEKKSDKNLSAEEHLVMVVVVEKVMPLPKLNNSNQYYLHKLQLKNYTTYDLQTNAVICYLIIECEGGSDANIFATLLRDIIRKRKVANPNLKYVIIYSDCCACQNRNSLLSNALLDLAMELNINIIQNVHSCIENAVRNKELYSLEDYVAAVESARRDEASGVRAGANAYNVELVSHKKFQNFENCKFYSSIRPGQGPGAPTVNQLRALQYTTRGEIFYKMKISDEWTAMPHTLPQPSRVISPKYTEQIPISAAKYRDLQKLKSFVPEHNRHFYEQIPHL